jgi:hypothetical protein
MLPSCPEVVVGGIQRLPTSKRFIRRNCRGCHRRAHSRNSSRKFQHERRDHCRTRRRSTLRTSGRRNYFILFFISEICCLDSHLLFFSCSIFVSEIWSSSGLHRNWESPEVEGLRRESMCFKRERESLLRIGTEERMAKEFEQSRCCEQLERAFCTVGWRLRSFRKQIRQMRQNKKKKEKRKTKHRQRRDWEELVAEVVVVVFVKKSVKLLLL